MCERPRYITPDRAAETILKQLSPASRLIVTGQIGCGKTTLASAISRRLGLTHLEIDVFNGDPEPMLAAAEAADAIAGGWVAEANVWQIPQAIWEASDFGIFLDYANVIHYPRIIRRCFGKCMMDRTWVNIRRHISEELLHLKIVYLYANENRAEWRRRGGITSTATPVIRCPSPRTTDRLLAHIDATTQLQATTNSRV
ncbi:MAG: hypothetical protein R3C14_21270 [Caldilineaceae bacterium]